MTLRDMTCVPVHLRRPTESTGQIGHWTAQLVSNFEKEDKSSHLFSPQPFNGQNEGIRLNTLYVVSL